jgi:hypothetical protein
MSIIGVDNILGPSAFCSPVTEALALSGLSLIPKFFGFISLEDLVELDSSQMDIFN